MFNALLSLIIIGLQGYTIFLLHFNGGSQLDSQNTESEMARLGLDTESGITLPDSKIKESSSEVTKAAGDLASGAPQLPNPSKFNPSPEKEINQSKTAEQSTSPSKVAENSEKDPKPSNEESSLLSYNNSFSKASLGSSSLLKK